MKKPKSESKKVRKFLGRLTLFTLLVAAVVGAYVLLDDEDYSLNQAEDITEQVRSSLETDIDNHVQEIDEWVILLGEKQQATNRDHSDHIKGVLVIKEELIEAKKQLRNADTNIRGIQAEVKHLINEFDKETEDVSFSVTTTVDS